MKDALGTIIVLSGPSGVGKSTLVGKVREALPDLRFSVSCTTRPPRNGEVNGVHYHFLSHEDFRRRLENDEFIEYAPVFANFYGTLKSEVFAHIRRGDDVLLDIDVQGAMQIRAAAEKDEFLKRSCEFVFIGPPSVGVLEQRLRGRATDSEEQILLRLGKSREELAYWRKYDYLVVNDQVEEAAERLLQLLRSFRLKTARLPEELFNA